MLNITKTQAQKQFDAAKAEAQKALKIAKDNLAFASMTKAEKRIQIAKDVLLQLAMNKITAESGTYISQSYDGVSCNACALGAVFVCTAERVGNKLSDLTDVDYYDPEVLREQLSPFFTEDQLGKIECAFEGWDSDDSEYGSNATLAFNQGVDDDRERMERVMKNIIRNNGTFVPSDRG